ncbi:unnamed protein product, partial [Closterium sp. NIES-54]
AVAAGTAPIAAIVAAPGSFASRGRAGGGSGGGDGGDGGGGSLLGVTGSGGGGDNDAADPEQQKQQDEWQQQQQRHQQQQQTQQGSDPQPQHHHQQQQQRQKPISTTAITVSSSADEASTGDPSATTAETAVTAPRVQVESPGGESSADHANFNPNAYGNPSAIHAYASANGGGDGANASGANSAGGAGDARGAGGAGGESWGSQRFYTVTGEGDYCAGESHWTWSFLCAAAEAKALNRTLIIPMARCLDARHTLSHLTEEKPMVLYYAMDHWPRMQPIMLDLQFELSIGPLNVTILRERHNMSVRVFEARAPTSRLESEDARSATLIMRRALFAYQMCDERRARRLVRNYNLIQRPMYLRRLAEAIRRSIGGEYDAVHVRRGDKLNRYWWPHVDRDTRPDACVRGKRGSGERSGSVGGRNISPKLIKLGRHVYIASNERTPGFFSPLASLYKIHVLSDYRHLWAPGSDWYNACWELMQRQRVSFRETGPVFDAQMQWIVDQLILSQARKRVETFPDLTNDKKHASLR